MPSDLVRWSNGQSMPFDFKRSEINLALDEFLTWPGEVFSHIVLLVRINHPGIAKQLQEQLGVTAEELSHWADGEKLPDQNRRAAIMELLMQDY
jgi:hypothetical protein